MHEKILELAIKGIGYTAYLAAAIIFCFTVYTVCTASSFAAVAFFGVVGPLMTFLITMIGASILHDE